MHMCVFLSICVSVCVCVYLYRFDGTVNKRLLSRHVFITFCRCRKLHAQMGQVACLGYFYYDNYGGNEGIKTHWVLAH